MQYTNKKRLEAQEFVINEELAKNIFFECNKLFFDNKIPELPIEIINSTEVNGNFKYDIDFDNSKLTNFRIQISNSRKRTKQKYVSTIIHEMIHYIVISELSQETIDKAIWYYKDNKLDIFDELLYNNKYAHVNKWSDIADNINKLYGIKINKG